MARKSAKKSPKRQKKPRIDRNCPKDTIRSFMYMMNLNGSMCKGTITPRGPNTPNNDLGDMNDLMCVIAGDKPIALIANDPETRKAYVKYGNFINRLVGLSRNCRVGAIPISIGDSKELIAFKPHNIEKALMLGYLYEYGGHYMRPYNNEMNHYLVGKLLGYSDDNIRAFLKNDYKYKHFKEITPRVMKELRKSHDFANYKFHKLSNGVNPLQYYT